MWLEGDEARIWYAAEYNTWRRYGGPEEGGWWYDSGELDPRSVVFFNTEAEAYDYAEHVRARLRAEGFNRYDGRDVRVYPLPRLVSEFECEYDYGDEEPTPRMDWSVVEWFPDKRPHYC